MSQKGKQKASCSNSSTVQLVSVARWNLGRSLLQVFTFQYIQLVYATCYCNPNLSTTNKAPRVVHMKLLPVRVGHKARDLNTQVAEIHREVVGACDHFHHELSAPHRLHRCLNPVDEVLLQRRNGRNIGLAFAAPSLGMLKHVS